MVWESAEVAALEVKMGDLVDKELNSCGIIHFCWALTFMYLYIREHY